MSDTAASLPVPRLIGAKQTSRAEAAASIAERTDVALVGDFVRPTSHPAPARVLTANVVSDGYLVTAVRAPGEALAAFGGTVRDTARGGILPRIPPQRSAETRTA